MIHVDQSEKEVKGERDVSRGSKHVTVATFFTPRRVFTSGSGVTSSAYPHLLVTLGSVIRDMPTLQIEMHLSMVLIPQPSSLLETRTYMAQTLVSSKTIDHVPSQGGIPTYPSLLYHINRLRLFPLSSSLRRWLPLQYVLDPPFRPLRLIIIPYPSPEEVHVRICDFNILL